MDKQTKRRYAKVYYEKHKNNPKFMEARRKYMKEYYQRPEVKAKQRGKVNEYNRKLMKRWNDLSQKEQVKLCLKKAMDILKELRRKENDKDNK